MRLYERKTTIDRLNGLRISKGSMFLCSASFEDRSAIIPFAVDAESRGRVVVCRNDDVGKEGEKNEDKIVRHFGQKIDRIFLSKADPSITVRELSELFNALYAEGLKKVYIDITCFTREALLILIRVLGYRLDASCQIVVLYNMAASYGGVGSRHNWLSRGVSAIRPVIGFSGDFISTKPPHLIVLSGYEMDRLQTIFESITPAKVTLLRTDPAQGEPYKVTKYREAVIEDALRRYGCITEMFIDAFSVNDVIKKVAEIQLNEQGYSYLISPLSTKVSTLGVGLLAMIREDIQLLYVRPASYNKKKYSEPSNVVWKYAFRLAEVEDAISALYPE